MSLLTEPLRHHHKHCDELFAAAEAAAVDCDWTVAQRLLPDFIAEMETHFRTEEEVLFPAFEAATGMTMGPTRMMRLEHAQMRDLFSQMRSTLVSRVDATGYLAIALGESVAGGPASAGHCANIMNSTFRDFGAACARNDAAAYQRYWTQDFATPR